MKKALWMIITGTLMFSYIDVLAWNDDTTHPKITEMAIEASSFDQYLQNQLMIASGQDENIKGKELQKWLEYGAKEEDNPACRASNHFHDPYRIWDQAGLTDMQDLIGWWCWLTSPFPPEEISSNLVWATGFIDSSGTNVDSECITQNEWDWNSAREYFYIYLAGKDFSGDPMSLDLAQRNEYLAKTLRAIGQVMHLLQDSAVPAHVRNDFSQGHLMINPGPGNPLKWIGNGFEKHVERNDRREWFDLSPIKVDLGSSPWQVTDLWDTDQLTYSYVPSDMSTLGISEYTTMNFFSEYSMFNQDFPFPKPEHCVVISSSPPVDVQSPLDRQYLSSQNGHPGEQVDHLAIVSYQKYFIETYVPNASSEKIPLSMDENCYDDYARRLIPRAIGHSSQLLDYFFRGKIELLPEVSDQGEFLGYVIENKTEEEEMEGTFEIFYDNTNDERVLLWSDFFTLGTMNSGNNKSQPFNLDHPDDAKEPGKYIVVFSGRLGNEADAVVGAVATLEDGEYVSVCIANRCIVWDIAGNDYASVSDSQGDEIDFPCDSSDIDDWLAARPAKPATEIVWDADPFTSGGPTFECSPEPGNNCPVQTGLCNGKTSYKAPCKVDMCYPTPGRPEQEDCIYHYKDANCCGEYGPLQNCKNGTPIYITWRSADFYRKEQERYRFQAAALGAIGGIFGSYVGRFNGYEGFLLNRYDYQHTYDGEGNRYGYYNCKELDGKETFDMQAHWFHSYKLKTFLGDLGQITFRNIDISHYDNSASYDATHSAFEKHLIGVVTSSQDVDFNRYKIGLVADRSVLFIFLFQYREIVQTMGAGNQLIDNYEQPVLFSQAAAKSFDDTSSINPFSVGKNSALTIAVGDLVADFYSTNGVQDDQMLQFDDKIQVAIRSQLVE